MPEVGEIRNAREVGLKTHWKVIWLSCLQCGKGRWVQFQRTRQPQFTGLCLVCAGKLHGRLEKAEARAGAEERFWAKVKKGNPTDCWEWMANLLPSGYGRFWFDGHSVYAHRFAYELMHGPIPHGFQIDHKCRNRACENPAHMEVVTNRTNVLRGVGITARFARKTHCPKGHPYDLFNTYIRPNGRRSCRECRRHADKVRRLRTQRATVL